jgi:hypothetical protein
MEFAELSLEQRRQLIDAKQAFTAWRDAEREFRHSYRGSMRWKQVSGVSYLYRIYGAVKKSLGPRSKNTEKIKDDYMDQRTRLRQRASRLEARLGEMDQLNRAHNLGRVPETAARVLRKLDEEGLLGRQLFVVGTHSLFAYESRSGVLFDGGLTTTADIDLLWDVRRRLSLAVADEVRQEGVMGLLRRVDKTFSAKARGYRAINDEGYYVDLIRPLDKNEALKAPPKLGDADDMEAAAIIGLQWLINAPKFEEVVIGADGRPLMMCCIDPRAFALHKYWMSRRPDREPEKRRRDAAQARAVASVASQYLNMPLGAKELSALPLELVKGAKELARVIGKKKSRSQAKKTESVKNA